MPIAQRERLKQERIAAREQHISEVQEQCENVPDEPDEAVTDDFEEEYEEEESMDFSMSM